MVYLVEFQGLKPRRIQSATAIVYTYRADEKAIAEHRWYGQRNGLSIKDGMAPRYTAVGMTEEEIRENWKKNPHWMERCLSRRKIRLNNEAWFQKRVPGMFDRFQENL